jgi:two-component system sensor histidine kinase KdpD
MRRIGRAAGDVLVAVLLSVAAVAVAQGIHLGFGLTRLAALFLAPVALTGAVRGLRAALFAAVLNAVFYRMSLGFWLDRRPPHLEDALNVAAFLLVAFLTGSLAGRLRNAADRANKRAETMERLVSFSRELTELKDEEAIWQHVCAGITKLTGSPEVVVIDAAGRLRSGASPQGEYLARHVLEEQLPGPARGPGLWRAQRMTAADEILGAVAWMRASDAEAHADGDVGGTDLALQIAADALLQNRAHALKLKMEQGEATARLREALLSSISHDFRTPLAAIIGSSSSLLEYGDKFPPETRRDLLLNIQEEADRLDHYVGNLLNMSKLQAGHLEANLREIGTADAVTAALHRLRKHHHLPVEIEFAGGCRVVADPLLLEQAIYNVLDNAMKHGHGHKGIVIAAEANDGRCSLAISDRGDGVLADDLSSIFERFHSSASDKRGSGLGLSIVKGFVEAMGGTVRAQSKTDDAFGLTIIIDLPRAPGHA